VLFAGGPSVTAAAVVSPTARRQDATMIQWDRRSVRSGMVEDYLNLNM
jgi:hypothetical protein